jgi:HSP20 family molecular chaperone IbpA
VFMSAPKLVFSSRPTFSSTIPNLLSGSEADALERVLSQKISERARLIFEQSGSLPGNDEANWLRAESEILRPGFEVFESATWVTLKAPIPRTSDEDIEIVVRPRRVTVHTWQTDREQNSAAAAERNEAEIFLAANLAVEVHPPSAAASFRDGTLRVMVKKRQPDNLTVSSESASK